TFIFDSDEETLLLDYYTNNFTDDFDVNYYGYPIDESATSVTVTSTTLTLVSDSSTTIYERDYGSSDNITGVWYNSTDGIYLIFAKSATETDEGTFIFSYEDGSDDDDDDDDDEEEADLNCFIDSLFNI
ncbi:MAG: hypothetical protein GY756_05605, partial [bacterium]|nr:hypothetical protein [bacterium]